MRFQTPQLLWLVLPWLVAWLLFARSQRRALAWVIENVSERFRARFSVHSPGTLAWHLRLLAVMGLLLIVAAARPYLPGETQIEAERARVVLIFDASASMFATDLGPPVPEGSDQRRKNRFEFARETGRALVEAMPATTFALVSFSGSTAIHTPMSANRGFLLDAIRGLEIHGQYQTTGSSLSGALDAIFEFQDETRPNLQAVILSDGEQPVEEDFSDTLDALEAQGVPVHTIAIGTTAGQGRLIYDFRDIVAKKEQPAVLREYHTRRVDETLEEISRRTGGTFDVLTAGTTEPKIAAAIRAFEAPPARIERTGTGTDLGVYLLIAFLAGLVADGLLIGRRSRPAPVRFEVERLGARRTPPARAAAGLLTLALLGSSGCADTPRARAHRENEAGIALDALRRYADARVHYQRSIGYGVKAEIPTFNLARSVHREGDYSEAHELYQEALKIDPKLPEAYYNDGIALFEWGEAERDPKGCDLERTHELWTSALQRFRRAVGLTRSTHKTGRKARANESHLQSLIAEIEHLIAEPPPECLSGGGADSQDQGGASGDGGDQEDPSQGGGSGGGDEPQDENQGGEGEDEGQGGDGEEQDEDGGPGDEDGEGDEGEGGGGAGDEGDEPEDRDQGDPGQSGGRPDEPDGDQPPPPPGEDQGGGDAPPPLTGEELERIAEELDRIGRQGFEEGKFHRRTLPEQFGEEHWRNPDRVIWW